MGFPKVVLIDPNQVLHGKTMPWSNLRSENNLQLDPNSGGTVLRDSTNAGFRVTLYKDVPRILNDILKNGAKIAIVSREMNKAVADRILWYFKATDPSDGKTKSIINLVKYDEVYNQAITVHIDRIKGWAKCQSSDMILFDADLQNHLARVVSGVTFHLILNTGEGLTWDVYQKGLDVWRGIQAIKTPYIGQNLSSYSQPMLIGYSGMDEQTVNLLTQGKNRVDLTESARWGYAMYVADDIRIANYFADWIKRDAFGSNAKTYVCEIWARDRAKFLATHKVWFPEDGNMMIDIKAGNIPRIAWHQEVRDDRALKWGAKAPYILFSRHVWMSGMSIPQGRWNEMVIWSQIQDAEILTIPMSDQQLSQKLQSGPWSSGAFHQQVGNWGIRMSPEAAAEMRSKGEWYS